MSETDRVESLGCQEACIHCGIGARHGLVEAEFDWNDAGDALCVACGNRNQVTATTACCVAEEHEQCRTCGGSGGGEPPNDCKSCRSTGLHEPPGVVVSSCQQELSERDRETIRMIAWELYDEHKANPDTSKSDEIIRRIRENARLNGATTA